MSNRPSGPGAKPSPSNLSSEIPFCAEEIPAAIAGHIAILHRQGTVPGRALYNCKISVRMRTGSPWRDLPDVLGSWNKHVPPFQPVEPQGNLVADIRGDVG